MTKALHSVFLAAVATGSLALGSSSESDITTVPMAIRENGGGGKLHKGFQSGSLKTSAYEKTLVISWHASAITNQEPDPSLSWNPAESAWGTHKSASGVQEISRKYYPTAAARVGSDAVLVSGIDDQGKTVIEKIGLNWPNPMPAPITDIQTGFSQVHLVNPNIGREKRLYDADVPGKRCVSAMSELRRSDGDPQQFVLIFEDSKDVYVGNLTGDNIDLTLLASRTNDQAPLGAIAALQGDDLTVIGARDHKTAGFVYTFVRKIRHSYPEPSAAMPTLVLVDSDRNGTVESFLTLDPTQWAQQSWGKTSSYNEWWLN